ncbi:type VI secretion system protein TssA [Pseudoduganella ginsengisoli]|uniref:Type VI secretion system protein TssA n=1 Tax=Pseudoduganella ginsengisoli TaxID=1462440 RepID=A0A6L6Q1N6_9BURK|nr:type VI secretion system protein TssA [Pseudoduganella ginsengisoli]MTW03753.1 type VI secretion system protein TssA [Pseudoduganella ginsengisoli]
MSSFSGNLRNFVDKARQLIAPEAVPAEPPPPIVPMIPNPIHPPTPYSGITQAQQDELDALLAPISADAPCGQALRFDPVFTEIRLAREEDDPSLPMGEWERPLKRADWPLIEGRCKDMLMHRSKDVQIAAWLLEAWTRQFGLDGLYRGLALIERLLLHYWDGVYPLIEDGDADARAAPLEWLNSSVVLSLRIHLPLLKVPGRKPNAPTLADWDKMVAAELAGPGHTPPLPAGEEAPLTRVEVIGYAQRHLIREMTNKRAAIKRCLHCLESLYAFLDLQLGTQAPNLSKLKATLVAIERVLAQFIPEHTGEEMAPDTTPIDPIPPENGDPEPGTETQVAVSASVWKNRNEAYATLDALADYLSLVEPHSPTPYLLRRAVNWGRMPLPELMAEIIREEGDLNRLVNMLGLRE